jgi:hypothetical protein
MSKKLYQKKNRKGQALNSPAPTHWHRFGFSEMVGQVMK